MGLKARALSLPTDEAHCQRVFSQTLAKVMDKTEENIRRFGEQFPYYGEGNRYTLTANSTWVSGYWTAWLWMAYYQTGDSVFKRAADGHFEGYNRRFNQPYIHCHDVGVIYDMTAVRGFHVTGEEKWKHVALRAAALLSTRFHEKGEFLQAWGFPGDRGVNGGRTIIDSLCCTPLWLWAAETTGDPYYRELAVRQARMIRERLVRPDYSSGHTFLFDPETEEPVGIRTAQGCADDSTWSRGQAWGIQGFPVSYAFTGDPDFLRVALEMLDWYVDRLPDSLIPPWDFQVPEEERDTSSLALAVNGMLRLAALQTVPEEIREACLRVSRSAMLSLIERHGAAADGEAWGLLREGVYHKPQNKGVGEFVIWGDYYFLENLMILAGKNPLQLDMAHRLGR
ncbi:glycoside hydrolase family 88 protein [Paenibacillus sp. YN15]|uniref:glycoside hydrolase family 88 protein n=1 Tax=Paenibacillus sp. YN15 TaxID=1742774 RepID=UPI000DCD79EC|nr:glycoside hydrolase family 88 protein [Paenibacillus sp. YN15]RAU93703.1 glucuronyl hydrolase [Paenibacillus sp. YN15]